MFNLNAHKEIQRNTADRGEGRSAVTGIRQEIKDATLQHQGLQSGTAGYMRWWDSDTQVC